MASVQNIGINGDKSKAENEGISPPTRMSRENYNASLNKAPTREAYWFAHSNSNDALPANALSDPKQAGDHKDVQLQKDKEEKIRQFRELQEEGRMKKLKDLENQFLQAQKLREQQEEERRRRIEEARMKESERRVQVEERKRQIWEAEQERKEAILRRNMDREARIEARRNAQRNSQCFAFGSSTPRSFDLDLAAIGVGRNSILMSSVSGRRSEERDIPPPRATSACSLDRKFENISHDTHFSSNPFRCPSPEPTPSCNSYLSKQIAMSSKSSYDMKACLSMCDNVYSLQNFYDFSPSGWLTGSGVMVDESCMSRSMQSLSSATFRGRRRTDITPTLTRERSVTPHSSASRGKDHSRSPSRPPSSMSGTSDVSATTSSSMSAVNMRPRPPPRRPRPYSIHGSVVDTKKELERQPRVHERNVSAPVKPQRARSASREAGDENTPRPFSAPKKPVPPPKSSEVLARAKSRPVPAKDNLRKVTKSSTDKPAKLEKKPKLDPKTNIEKSKPVCGTNEIEFKEKVPEPQNTNVMSEPETSSNLPSPITDSEKLISIASSTGADSNVQTMDSAIHPVEDSIVNSLSKINLEYRGEVAVTPEKEVTAQNIPNSMTESFNGAEVEGIPKDSTPKPRITSEEEARAALAEKRRLARELAEKEAELEMQRLEEIRRQEEEQRHAEEEEQQHMEEEQLRLAALHRQLEEEKLQKAIKEQQQREKEELEKREEEARLKAEREEQEKKTREEAEKQRIELEEKLRKEEEERAERKRRVEQIMARTRGKSAQSPSGSQSDAISKMSKSVGATSSNPNPLEDLNESNDVPAISNGIKTSASINTFNGTSRVNVTSSSSWSPADEKQLVGNSHLPDILSSENIIAKSNGHDPSELMSKMSVSDSFSVLSNRTLSANDAGSPQTNGYSSHEEMSCTTSPEETSSMDLLIDIQSIQQKSSLISPEHATDFNKLVDVDPLSLDNTTINNENFLINVDDVNSNLFNSANPFAGFEDSLQKKQDTAVTDLLS